MLIGWDFGRSELRMWYRRGVRGSEDNKYFKLTGGELCSSCVMLSSIVSFGDVAKVGRCIKRTSIVLRIGSDAESTPPVLYGSGNFL